MRLVSRVEGAEVLSMASARRSSAAPAPAPLNSETCRTQCLERVRFEREVAALKARIEGMDLERDRFFELLREAKARVSALEAALKTADALLLKAQYAVEEAGASEPLTRATVALSEARAALAVSKPAATDSVARCPACAPHLNDDELLGMWVCGMCGRHWTLMKRAEPALPKPKREAR